MSEHHHTSAATIAPLLPCPFCGPGQSMVDPWYDDVAKRWSIGCGRCGASSGRSVHAEGSKEAAIKAWNTRGVGDVAQSPVVLGPTQEDVVAHAIMMDDGCGLTINGQRTLCDDPRAMEKPDRCYCRRSAKAALAAIAAQPPAAPVETDQLHDSRNPNHGRTGGLRDQEPRCSAANGDALSIAETDREVMRQAIVEACDLLAERKYGNPARSPGHNARLVLERALSTGIPALPQTSSMEDVRQLAEIAIRAFCQSLGAGSVTIAADGVERIYHAGINLRALSVAVAMAVTRPHHSGDK
jgi:Lar family restriction alleviation protein